MPTLKDYLGSLVRDLNHARVIADVESANIAEMYAEHHLLKHFSIPRMKIKDTEFTIPVAIDELEILAEKDYQPIDNITFHKNTYAEIKNVFRVSSFNKEIFIPLRTSIYLHISHLETMIKDGADIETSLKKFCEIIANVATKTIKNNKNGRFIFDDVLKYHDINEEQVNDKLVVSLTKRLHPEIKQRGLKGKIANAKVTVETDKLKEKKPESLLYIKMKVTEESMEWQTMEDIEGNVVAKLMVE